MDARSLMARATEGTDAPTPGYLYVDLAKVASSNPVACQEMAQYLTRRLQSKNNANIKYKCCKVIAKLCDNVPRNQFRRAIAQDSTGVSAIKEALNFRGVMDPLRGDEPNQKVRIAAKEALDAVYREAPSVPDQSYGGAPSQYAGPSGGGGGGYGGSRPRMDGVGNPMFADPRLDPRYNGTQPTNVREALREAGDVLVNMIKDPLAKNIMPDVPMQQGMPQPYVPRQGHSGDLPGYGRSRPSPNFNRPPPGQAELARQTGGEWTMASNRGPSSIQNSEYYRERDTSFQWAQRQGSHSSSAGAVGGSWAGQSAASAPPSSNAHHVTTGPAAADGSYEKNLILELCPPAGLKPVPPPDKLANFARNLSSLNADLICSIVLDCLEDGQPWIIRAKAMCVVETCIQSGGRLDGSNPYRDFFHACQEEIAPLANHPRLPIREPAQRVLRLLGFESETAPQTAPVPAPPVAAAPPPNLLDFDDDTPTAPSPAPPVPVATPPPVAAAPATLFGGMQVKGSVGSAPAPATIAPAPAVAAPSADLLGDFTSPASSSNFFQPSTNGTTVPPPMATTTTTAATDMFAQMSLKTSSEANTATADVPAVPAPSAFGFINETTAPKETIAPVELVVPVVIPPNFDPLKNNMTPNTVQRKMMQVSPEQMQAMAYQQNMWMQQQAQMQMAMAMRTSSGGVVGGAGGPTMMMMPPMYPNIHPNPHHGMMMTAPPPPGGSIMTGSVVGGASPFSFKDARPAKKDDRKFDFVKDAMQTAGQKK